MADRTDGDILRGVELAQTCETLLASLSDIDEPVHLDMKVIHDRLQALGALLRSTQHLEGCDWLQMVLQDCDSILKQLHEEFKTRPIGCAGIIGQISSLTDVQNTLSLALNLNMRCL